MNQTRKELEEEKLILDTFAEYIVDSNKDFIYSEKFGLLCVSAWSVDATEPCDVMQIKSVDHLLEVLIEMLATDYLAEKEAICFTKGEAKKIRDAYVQQYVEKLTEYRVVISEKMEKVIHAYACATD